MKAKEYFEKYDKSIVEEAIQPEVKKDGAIAQLYIEMFSEMKKIIEIRHIQNDNSLMSLVREQNDKWNAIERLFIKKYKLSPIAHNGFLAGCVEELKIPQYRIQNMT